MLHIGIFKQAANYHYVHKNNENNEMVVLRNVCF